MRLRPWTARDTTAAQQLASRRWPSGPHPGGLGWSAAIGQLGERAIVAEVGDEIVGWACLGSGELRLLADPDDADTLRSLVDWGLEHATEGELSVSVFVDDAPVRTAVIAAGFAPATSAGCGAPGRRRRPGAMQPLVGMFREASTAGPRLPAGYHVRAVGEHELAERVDAHRAAWYPARLPWADAAHVTVDPAAQSRFTADHYATVRQTWLYDRELDLVIEAADGQLVATCLVWLDEASGCAEIEPVGVVADHRRRGLARALCDEASVRVAARGGHLLFINTGPDDDYPAPAATYLAAGFTVQERATRYLSRPSSL